MSHTITPPAIKVPSNEEAEQALLGALLVNNRAYEMVADFLRPEHFYDPAHQRIFTAIASEVSVGRKADPVTLRRMFDADPELAKEGGGAYLAELAGNVVTVVNAADYGKTIRDLFVKRQLIETALGLLDDVQNPDVGRSGADIREAHEAALMQMDDAGPRAQALVSIRDAVTEAIEAAETAHRSGTSLTGVTTGLHDLDTRLGGLQRGELIALGARPSMGKSDLAFNIATNAARAHALGKPGGAPTLMFSQEMVARQLGARFLARATGIPADEQRRGQLDERAFPQMAREIPNMPLWIDSTARVTPAHILRRARRLQQRCELGLIVVDHLNIMGAPDGFRSQGEVAVITEITREMKGVATTLDVPVLLLCQLSRQVEQRDDKRPTLSDLRQSGSIEQDADTVMFLYRDEYYISRMEPMRKPDEDADKFNSRYERWQQSMSACRNVADVIVAKQRMGPVGTTSLFYDGARSLFADMHRN